MSSQLEIFQSCNFKKSHLMDNSRFSEFCTLNKQIAMDLKPIIEKRGYKKELGANRFIKRYGKGFYETIEINFIENYILIWDNNSFFRVGKNHFHEMKFFCPLKK